MRSKVIRAIKQEIAAEIGAAITSEGTKCVEQNWSSTNMARMSVSLQFLPYSK